jgi:hypothetical protein
MYSGTDEDAGTFIKEKTEHPGAYIPTRFASLPTLSLCSLQTCSDFPLYGVPACISCTSSSLVYSVTEY